jgi:hypothetical protein
MRPNPVIISCTSDDWQNVVKTALADGVVVDLVNFKFSFDAEHCVKLARLFKMDFRFDPKTDSGFFRKRKPQSE